MTAVGDNNRNPASRDAPARDYEDAVFDTVIKPPARSIFVAAAGNLALKNSEGDTVVFALPSAGIWPLEVREIVDASTNIAVGNIKLLY